MIHPTHLPFRLPFVGNQTLTLADLHLDMLARITARTLARSAAPTFNSRLQQPIRCFAAVRSVNHIPPPFILAHYIPFLFLKDRFKYDNAHVSNAEELIAQTDVITVDGPTAYCEGGMFSVFPNLSFVVFSFLKRNPSIQVINIRYCRWRCPRPPWRLLAAEQSI